MSPDGYPKAPARSLGGVGNASAPLIAADNPQPGALPPLSVPKGGGAIRGIGETFAANLLTGTGALSVPIATSPAERALVRALR
jgi:hypothetical protein